MIPTLPYRYRAQAGYAHSVSSVLLASLLLVNVYEHPIRKCYQPTLTQEALKYAVKHEKRLTTYLQVVIFLNMGRDSIIGTETRYGLDGLGIEYPVWVISVHVQASYGAHPASYTMGTGSLARRISGRGVTITIHPIQRRG
jgi:hypothetical protein